MAEKTALGRMRWADNGGLINWLADVRRSLIMPLGVWQGLDLDDDLLDGRIWALNNVSHAIVA